MYVLHSRPGWGSFAVEAVLAEAGAKYRLVEVDTSAGEHRSKTFLKLNPMGQVPVLELPGGQVMTESAAMVLYLADRLAEGSLAPKPASKLRPAYLRWLTFMTANVYTADQRLYYPDRFTTDPAGADGVKAAGLRDMERWFAMIDEAIGPGKYLLGRNFTAADPYLLMLAYWHPEPAKLLSSCRNLARVCETVRSRKAIAALNAYHRLW
jgi:glutathione S-transferase